MALQSSYLALLRRLVLSAAGERKVLFMELREKIERLTWRICWVPLLLGIAGYWLLGGETPWNALYASAALYFVNPVSDISNVFVILAKYTALFVTASIIFQALETFADWIRIGLIAGIMCQIPMLNATPLVNIPSEVLGALACGLLINIPIKIGGMADINPFVTTFLSTVVSGYTFAIIVGLMNGLALPVIFVTYAIMVFGTATFNAILVQILTPLLRKVLKK